MRKATRGGRRQVGGLRILIGSGPTREPLDAVRYLSNYSTGVMGAALAAEALARGHRVTVVTGPSQTPLPARATVVPVEQAAQMAHAMRRAAPRADAVIMAAAVADFRPSRLRAGKLSRRRGVTLRLVPTQDVIGSLPRRKAQVIAGFAVESSAVLTRARRKLREKRLDLLLVQQTGADGSPFGRRPVRAWLLERAGAGQPRVKPLGRVSKARVAGLLLDKVEALCYGQGT